MVIAIKLPYIWCNSFFKIINFYIMKFNLYLVLLLLISQVAFAQIVNIPDPVFKDRLVNHENPVIDTNGDGEIQVSEAEAVYMLHLDAPYGTATIQDATGLEAFVNLFNLNLSGNNLSSIDLTSLTNLIQLNLNDNNIASIDLSQNQSLSSINMGYNELTFIDFSNNPNLSAAEIYGNHLTEIDVSNNPILLFLNIFENNFLTHVNLSNGISEVISLGEGFLWTPNLEIVCVDEGAVLSDWNLQQLADIGAIVTTNCNFDLINYNSIGGDLKYNLGAGCDDYTSYGIPNVIVKSEDANHSYATLTGSEGSYLLKVEEGDFTTTVISDFPTYFTLNPNTHSSSFTGYDNVDVKNFCMESVESTADLNVSISGSNELQDTPNSFCFSYFVTIENMGTEVVNGQGSFQYDNDNFNFQGSSPNYAYTQDGLVAFEFYNLRPLNTVTYSIVLNRDGLQYDYPLSVGDQVDFTANVTPIESDITPENNTFVFTQTVVSSYDPNDKNVMEGEEITLVEAEDYLHYTVRFQNTGNANADRVIITDTLSEKLDWITLKMLSASHNYRVDIEDEQILHYTFNNIDLAYEDADDEGSQGYIAYKIKPKSNLEVGDVISSPADIFFDFNPPIRTNEATTTIVENLSVEDYLLNEDIKVYPNPTKGVIYIETSGSMKVENMTLFSLNGKRVLQKSAVKELDLSTLSEGVYFLKITDKAGKQAVKKIIKK